MEWLTEIAHLRERIPVGIKAAQRLLSSTKGDVAAAVACFRAQQAALLVNKAQVTSQEAERLLHLTEYDIARALRYIEQQRYTLTELILLKNKNATDAQDKIALAIEFEWQLNRHYWFNDDDLKHLPPVLHCFMLIWEWRNYAGWEGFPSALFFDLTAYCDQLTLLELHDVAETVLAAKKRYDALLAIYGNKAHQIICRDEQYKTLEAQYYQQECAIDDALLTLAKNNLDVFPGCHQDR